jgi:pimeloyl-ACP methyl ester carboxylesterase
LFSTGIRLAVHIQDVINLIGCEELDNVVLVGHSYAGMVITGVADALMQQERPVLRHLVYLDAIVPHPGESWSSQQSPEAVAARIKSAMTEGGGVAILPPDPRLGVHVDEDLLDESARDPLLGPHVRLRSVPDPTQIVTWCTASPSGGVPLR